MKRIIALVLTVILSASILVSCSAGLPRGLNGKEASKLLLARQRMSSDAFNGADSIFSSGEEAFLNLYAIADENLNKFSYGGKIDDGLKVSLTSLTNKNSPSILSEKHTSADGSSVEIDGDTYTWRDFKDYSNSYEYFVNITNSVKTSAETASKLIDDMKKHVRIVDTWISHYDDDFYLMVDEDSETLINRNKDSGEIRICTRYKRDDGANVYELFVGTDIFNSRMVYIPGEQFYYSHNNSSADFSHQFFAENTKGYWEIVDIGNTQLSCMIIKDNIFYDAVYDTTTQEFLTARFISADKETDILTFSDIDRNATDIGLFLQAFNGIDKVVYECKRENIGSPDDYQNDNVYLYESIIDDMKIYSTSGRKSPKVVLSNGTVLNYGDKLLDGKITIGRTLVNNVYKETYNDYGYFAELTVTIQGDTLTDKINTFNEFLDYVGLTSKKSLVSLESDIIQAFSELKQFVKYKTWNNSLITTYEDVNIGRENNEKVYESFWNIYNSVKDKEVISKNDIGALSSRMTFPPIVNQSVERATFDKGVFTVNNLTVSVSDTMLFVENEPYVLKFALLGTSGKESAGLNIIEHTVGASTVFTSGNDEFSISASASFSLPSLEFGTYTLVAFISTEDGIRASDYKAVMLTEINTDSFKQDSRTVTVGKTEASELILTLSYNNQIEYALNSADKVYSYDEMLAFLNERAYEFGYTYDTASLEYLSADGTWVSASSAGALATGSYRLKFEIRNGSHSSDGYVIANYS